MGWWELTKVCGDKLKVAARWREDDVWEFVVHFVTWNWTKELMFNMLVFFFTDGPLPGAAGNLHEQPKNGCT